MPGCIRDSAPDAWGRRVLINKSLGLKGADADSAQLDELTYLLESAELVEKGIPLTVELDQALCHGSSIGGARPKALIDDDDTKYIAKFSLKAVRAQHA